MVTEPVGGSTTVQKFSVSELKVGSLSILVEKKQNQL